MGRQQGVPRSPEDTGKTPMDGRGMPKDGGKGEEWQGTVRRRRRGMVGKVRNDGGWQEVTVQATLLSPKPAVAIQMLTYLSLPLSELKPLLQWTLLDKHNWSHCCNGHSLTNTIEAIVAMGTPWQTPRLCWGNGRQKQDIGDGEEGGCGCWGKGRGKLDIRDCEERGSGRWGNEGERQGARGGCYGASKACQRKKGDNYPIVLLFPGIWVSPNISPNLNSNCQFYKGACNKNKCSQGCHERPLGLA